MSDTENDEPILTDEFPHLKEKVSTPFDEHVGKFTEYLMGRDGGGRDDTVATNITRDILKFINFITHVHPEHRSSEYRDILLNKHLLQEYIDYLEQNVGLQPSTLMNKVKKPTFAIEFVNFVDDPHGTDLQLSNQCKTLAGVLQKWIKSLCKPRATQRSEQNKASSYSQGKFHSCI